MRRNWTMLCYCVCAALLLMAALPVRACVKTAHVRPAEVVKDDVGRLFEERDFAQLDVLARRYERESKSTFDGQSSLMAFYQGIGRGYNACADVRKSDAEWQAHESALKEWIKASSDPVPARLALALFTIDSGWRARGSGYANSVGSDAWTVFRERIASAKAQLDSLAKPCAANPAWYAGMLDIGLAQGWKPAQFDAMYDKAARIDPYYLEIHYARAEFYSPRWYGSDQQLQDAILRGVKLTRPRLGEAMYARLVWTYLDYGDMFKDGSVEWKHLKLGFDDALHRYPNDWIRSHYARLACTANDSATLKNQLAELGDRVRQDAWDNKDYFTYCKKLAELDGTGRQPQCFRRMDTGAALCE